MSTSSARPTFPASPIQRQIWEDSGGGVHEPLIEAELLIRGPANVQSAAAALRRIVQRHEILRTRLRVTSDLLEQVVSDVDDGDPLRARWDAEESGARLYLLLSAAVADATTVELLAAELASTLAGESAEPKLQHGDIARWILNAARREEAAFGSCKAGGAAGGAVRGPFGHAEVRIPETAAAALEDAASRVHAPAEAAWLACWRSLAARVFKNGTEPQYVRLDGRWDPALSDALGPLTGAASLDIEWPPKCDLKEAIGATAEWLEKSRPRVLRATAAPAAGVAFAFRSARELCAAGPFNVEIVRLEDRTRRWGIEVSCTRHPGRASVCVRWDRFADAELAQRFAGWYAALVDAAGRSGGAALDSLPLAPPEAYRNAAASLDGGRSGASRRLAHERFEAAAARNPDGVAIIESDHAISYGQLNARSNRLAHHLRACGLVCGDIVAILLDRSIDEVVSVLAALKAGAAFLLIDPHYPQERIRKILETDRVPLVMTNAALAPLVCSGATRILDVEEPQIGLRPATPPGITLPECSPAYVVYTSGSTGTPKGGVNTHLGTCNLLAWMEREMEITAGHRFLRKTPGGFDAGVWELLLPLSAGGLLVIAPPGAHQNMSAMTSIIRRYAIDVVHFVPSMLRPFVDDPGIGACGSLAFVLCGGEPVTPELRSDFRARLPGATLLHFYGPSETAVDTTYWRDPGEWSGRIPIGRPLAGVRLRIVDEAGNDAPPGMPGELLVCGAGVGAGYHRRPALTGEKFLPDAGGPPGSRCYRTGDVVRLRPDGALDFLGRSDQQMKVAGVRMEAGELESAIEALPGVRQAAVVLRDGPVGPRTLAAFVVVEADVDRSPERFRAALASLLPEAMIPPLWVFPDSLPRLPGGKLDRRALAAHPLETGSANRLSSVMEDALAALWRHLFTCGILSPESSFFESGGSSLAAIRLVGLVREAFGVELPVTTVFARPRLRDLARHIEELMGSSHPRESIPAGTHHAPRRLSFAQEQLWLLHQMDPGNAAYNVVEALRLRGSLDLVALRHALDKLLERHQVLATTIRNTPDGPRMEIHAGARIPFRTEDFSSGASERALGQVLEYEAAAPFRLEAELPVRAVLVRLADREHILTLTLHHIACDDASLTILLRDALDAYAAAVDGRFPQRAPLTIQYADFAEWQHTHLAETLDGQLKYWNERLAAPLPRLQLPGETAGPAAPRYRRLSRVLPAEFRDKVAHLGRTLGATPFAVSCAAYAAVLARVCREERIVIGTPVDNRDQEALQELVGLFVNLLPLSIDTSGNPDFAELAARTRAAAIGALAHRDAPFDAIVSAVAPERAANSLPLVRTAFVQYDRLRPPLTAPGLEIEPVDTAHATTKMDLLFTVDATAPAWSAMLEFDGARVDAAVVESILTAWVAVVHAAAADPHIALDALTLVDAEERHGLAHRWNPGVAPLDGPGIAARFERIAAESPDRIALHWGGGAFTYRRLADTAAAVAARLRSAGAGPEVIVAVLLDPSPELAAAILGIVQAACAFVPLRPSDPPSRISWMCEDAGAQFVVVATRGAAGTPAGPVAIAIDECTGAPLQRAVTPEPSAKALACVLYTSGSTGKPKGVSVTHGAILRLVCGQRQVQLTAEDHVAQLADPSFDAFLFELWGALLNGARLVGIAREEMVDPPAFAARLRAERITAAFVTAALLQHTADVIPSAFRWMRVLIFGGEAADPRRLEAIRRSGAPGQLLNGYGPTETTTFATWGAVGEAPGVYGASIGWALTGARVYVLDRRLEPCPVGIPGELYIAGEGVARGYIRRPRLTAERFIPDPFSRVPGGVMYATGDLGRRLEDGSIEFAGRVDDQLKIRGHRIEPGEVAAALREHPAVRDAMVIPIETGAGCSLAAHLTARNARVPREELTAFLRSILPSYMVPDKFFWHDSMPLTQRGKVDRAALERWTAEEEEEPVAMADAPQTAVEQLVVDVWSEALGAPVGRYDDFFDRGGHSLLASGIAARLSSRIGRPIPLKLIFECRTPASLAAAIDVGRSGPALVPPPRRSGSAEDSAPLALQQEQVWLLEQLFPGHAFFHVNVVCRMGGPLDLARLERSLHSLAMRHEALRTTFTFDDSTGPAQKISPEPIIDYHVFDPETADEARRGVADVMRRPFDLQSGPLWRVTVARLSPAAHVLAVSVHHIICDGAALDVLVRELGALYRNESLPEVLVQYRDFARWQREYLTPERLPQQMRYWRDQLGGEPEALPLGGRGVRPELDFRMQTAQVSVDERVAARFRTAAAYHGATLFSSVLASLALALRRFTGCTDFRIATQLANRSRIELERVVGLLTNMAILRLDLAGVNSPGEVLRAATKAVVDAVENGDLPFEQILAALQAEWPIERRLLAQVLLLVEEERPAVPEIPGVSVLPYDSEEITGPALSGHDCILRAAWRKDGMTLTLQYKESAVDSEAARGLLQSMIDEIECIAGGSATKEGAAISVHG